MGIFTFEIQTLRTTDPLYFCSALRAPCTPNGSSTFPHTQPTKNPLVVTHSCCHLCKHDLYLPWLHITDSPLWWPLLVGFLHQIRFRVVACVPQYLCPIESWLYISRLCAFFPLSLKGDQSRVSSAFCPKEVGMCSSSPITWTHKWMLLSF